MPSLKPRTPIQKTLAIFLVLVFALGTAPKAWFHDLVADHKDQPDCRQLHHSKVLHQKAPNCHFDDLVVSAPFLFVTDLPILSGGLHYIKKVPVFYSSPLQSLSLHKENRGPPSLVEFKSSI
ncbi:MAG: hypothetical protein ACXVBH_05510 [Flavisolibacter sp.]